MENNLKSKSDEELMLEIKSGNNQVFDELVNRHKDSLSRFIYRLINEHEKSNDLVQETFLQIYHDAKKYKVKAKFTTWLYKIARNLSLKELRNRKRHPYVSLDKPLSTEEDGLIELKDTIVNESEINPVEKLLKKETEKQIEESLDSLPETYREVVIMRLFQNLSFQEISSILKCSEGAARVRMHYAISVIRDKLFKKPPK